MSFPAFKAPISCLLGVVVTGLWFQLMVVSSASAEPPVETVVAERTNPAVQVITVEYTASASLGGVTLNNNAWKLFERGIAKARAGELVSVRAVAAWVFDHIRDDPTRYYRTVGSHRTVKMSSRYVGSGFIAAETGYVVTARHVVTPDPAIRNGFVSDGVAAFAKTDGDAMVRLFRKWDLSRATKRDIRASVAAFDRAKVKVNVSPPRVAVLLGVASVTGARIGQTQPADVVYRSAPALGEDIGVLRVRVAAKLPALALATDAPGQGSQIYVNCFPAAATWTKGMSEAARLQPTLSSGQVTALKASTGGINLLQTNAAASPGCSGGPALNEAGAVVGILVSGAVDSRGIPVGQNYVQPGGLIGEALRRSALDIKPSLTTDLYNQALTDYHHDYFTKALEEFKAVQALYPAHAYVGTYITDSQAAISAGRDKTSPTPPTIPPVAVGALLAFALLIGASVVAFVIARWHRTNPARQQPHQLPAGQATGRDVPTAPEQDPASTPGPDDPSNPTIPHVDLAATAMTGVEDPHSQDVEAVDDEAPDTFPAWRPIDFVPAYPAADTDTPAQPAAWPDAATQPPSPEDLHR
ncbi:serine protease [Microlunatus ginsengisoli]|uniref:Trypsin-like peptidase domain-containing protein n=1 Tax=Microlunatus ginsengisoli TaxID=363863 RepID=A0ABP7AQS5_9ACTN